MKTSLMWKIVGGSAALIMSAHAHAAYTGLFVEWSDPFFSNHPNAAVRDAWNAGPVNQYDIFRLYAHFNSATPADRVNAVAGNALSPLNLQIFNGGQFYNYTETYGPDTIHFNTAFTGASPVARSWDTYVTIGSALAGSSTQLAPGFGDETDNLAFGASGFSSTNTGWFITPDDAAGQAVSSAPGQTNASGGTFRVLLGQFTVTQGSYFFGNFLINVNGINFHNQVILLPSPAALALFGLAGMLGARRRRS